VRVELRATLDGAQFSLQMDIGFGDVVTPPPETLSYPVLLDDLPAPRLRAYPKYTVVAEMRPEGLPAGLSDAFAMDAGKQAPS
jgi:hypothetical protein